MKKAFIMLVHILTSLVIYAGMMIYMIWYYDYTVLDLLRSLVLWISLICFDYFICRYFLTKEDTIIRKPKLLHGVDIIAPLSAGLLGVYEVILDFFEQSGITNRDELGYKLVFVTCLLIISASLIVERRSLVKCSHTKK